MEKKERKCRGCPKIFIPKRLNQYFHDEKCRSDYNNARAKTIRDEKKKMQRPLDKNYLILKKLLGNNESVTKSYDFLLGSGFDFRFYTNKGVNKEINYKGAATWAVFKYALISLPKNNFLIYKATS